MKLEKYDNSNKITPELIVLHKRYDLLRTILWQQFILAKKKCGVERNTVVYLYQYRDPSIETRGIQGAISNYLTDLDNKYPDKIVLIPIAADLDLSSLELMKSFYGIDSYPIVIVNENIRFRI